MTVPALTNGPWVFSVNHNCPGAEANEIGMRSIFQVKQCLVSFAAWSAVASSDSLAVKNIGDGSPDLWTAYTDLIWGNPGVVHSWVILENSVTGEQLCLDCNYTGVIRWMEVVYSATGAFAADGTTSNRPTDTESQVILKRTSNWLDETPDGAVVHAMISADGKCTRWYVHQRDGEQECGWYVGLEELANPPVIWTSTHKRCVFYWDHNIVMATAGSGMSPTATNFDPATAKWYCYLKDATPYEGWNTCRSTAECYNGFNTNSGDPFYRNETLQTWLGNAYPVSPIGMYRDDAVRGAGLGKLQDIYWGYINHRPLDTYDGDSSREWIKFGCFMVPWNGTEPLRVP